MITTHGEDLSSVFERINQATSALRRSDEIPSEVEELVDSFDGLFHAESPLGLDVDPSLSTPLFAGALRAVKAMRHDDVGEQRRGLRIALEQVRHALRDILDAAPFTDDVPIEDVLANLTRRVSVPQPELAELLGISTRQFQRWLKGDSAPAGNDEARVRMVARIVNELRHAFTAPGVVAWFRRKHPQLGEPPLNLLDDPVRYPQLLNLARGSRAMAA